MNKLTFLSLVIVCCVLNAKSQEALTPRDAFWSASDLSDLAPNPAVPKTVPNKDQPAHTETAKPAPPGNTQEKVAKSAEPRSGTSPKPPTTAPRGPKLIASKGYGVEPHIVKFSNPAQKPLGIRYALLKVTETGELSEVLPETVFHSGDKVKISLMANQPGYIHIIQQGSSGSWRPLFPAQGDPPESNRVEAGRIYQVPAGKSFQFNEQTGSERLFILLSRRVVSDLDRFIFTLQQQQRDPANPATSAPAQVEASNRISDNLVQSLKSRDLMEVEDPPQETKDTSLGENAIYVVSEGKGNSIPSQVFANLVLDHR
jgi:Domain of unknown function (DUF4384)